jgi:CubicO group peptidase (beta-lactamase class C family)
MIDATTGVYPIDTESPIMRTFFSVLFGGNGGPYLHTATPVTLPPPPSREGGAAARSFVPTIFGTHVVVKPQPGYPGGWVSTQVVPDGQHVRELLQHVASAHGQQLLTGACTNEMGRVSARVHLLYKCMASELSLETTHATATDRRCGNM